MGTTTKPLALEFFAGGGLARLGLGDQFDVVWANDIDPKKCAAWRANFGDGGCLLGDIHDIDPNVVPQADLAWASFPCQDLSLAGGRAGLVATRSGSFYGFIEVIKGLQATRRTPRILVIENVSGLLTSNNGHDYAAVLRGLADLGYGAGALEVDARHFVPQSRPRIFIIAYLRSMQLPASLITTTPMPSSFCSPMILKAWQALPETLRDQHIWWALPAPTIPTLRLTDIIDATDQSWWSQDKTDALVDSLSPRHRAKLRDLQATQTPHIGAVYRRTRRRDGVARSYAEVRFDGLAGCLRTPSGGSSRQFWLFVQASSLRARPVNPREAMRLMGVPENYILPANTLAGLKIAGDGVAVPVVAWLCRHLLNPLVALT